MTSRSKAGQAGARNAKVTKAKATKTKATKGKAMKAEATKAEATKAKVAKVKVGKAKVVKNKVSKATSSAAGRFLKAFGPGEPYRAFTPADDARLGDRIPEVMRAILGREGWCSYKEQVLWLCDPDDWEAAARAWFPGARARVVARTGFGDLCVREGRMFYFVMVHESLVMEMVDDPDLFFSFVLSDADFAPQTYLPAQVRAAREQAGPLEWDEMYAHVPALALGGSVETSRVERVKAAEALAMLAGLAPIRRV